MYHNICRSFDLAISGSFRNNFAKKETTETTPAAPEGQWDPLQMGIPICTRPLRMGTQLLSAPCHLAISALSLIFHQWTYQIRT